MRNCLKCVYAKWLDNKRVYCMFFSSPICPKGKGDELNFEKPKPKAAEIVVTERPEYPPPYVPRKRAKPKGNLRENHYRIYQMRYEEMMYFKDIAKEFDVSASAIMGYMSRCDNDYIESGHKEWEQFVACFKFADMKQDGLTEDGNVPPFEINSKFATKHVNSPLRKNHDKIFNLRKQGYLLSEIAEMLGLSKGSLYTYVERCENEWANRNSAGD